MLLTLSNLLKRAGMRLLALGGAVILMAATPAMAGQIVIDFESQPTGLVTNAYIPSGVAFDGVEILSYYYQHIHPVEQSLHYAHIVNDGISTITFVDPLGSAKPFMTTSVSFTLNGFDHLAYFDGWLNGFYLKAFDASGKQIASTLHQSSVTTLEGRDSYVMTISGAIHQLQFASITSPTYGSGANPFDNLLFNEVTPASQQTPEPFSIVTTGLGLLILLILRFRARFAKQHHSC